MIRGEGCPRGCDGCSECEAPDVVGALCVVCGSPATAVSDDQDVCADCLEDITSEIPAETMRDVVEGGLR